MNKQRPSREFTPADKLAPEQVLTDWIAAVTCFHFNYNHIYNFVHAHTASEKTYTKAKRNVSQCSISQLELFLDEMQEQLEILLTDVGSSGQPLTQANYRKLVAHTDAMERLNQQAQKMLVLTILPAS